MENPIAMQNHLKNIKQTMENVRDGKKLSVAERNEILEFWKEVAWQTAYELTHEKPALTHKVLGKKLFGVDTDKAECKVQ